MKLPALIFTAILLTTTTVSAAQKWNWRQPSLPASSNQTDTSAQTAASAQNIENQQINEQLIQESLLNPKENYYILFYIIYFEINLTKDLNETIALSLLKNMNNKINPILTILMSNLEISNKLVQYILTITTDEYIEENFSKLGEKPFDFRYHILKRKEVDEALKNEVVAFPSRPKIIDIQIGENAASEIYIRNKGKAANSVGIDFDCVRFGV